MKKSQLARTKEAEWKEKADVAQFEQEHEDVFLETDTERYRDARGHSLRTILLDEEQLLKDRVKFTVLGTQEAREWTPALEEKVSKVERILGMLTREQAELLLAHYAEGKSFSELAQNGVSRQSVHNRVKRAKARFVKEWMKRES